ASPSLPAGGRAGPSKRPPLPRPGGRHHHLPRRVGATGRSHGGPAVPGGAEPAANRPGAGHHSGGVAPSGEAGAGPGAGEPAAETPGPAAAQALLPCWHHRDPGAGKSTFIECIGQDLVKRQGKRIAVLTVDPSSGATGGSLLGDATRMPELCVHPSAFVRSTPSGGSLGGVARYTQNAAVLCEAAGFDCLLIETMGVGQAEYQVNDMVDMFLLLQSPGGGDELQGVKRGVMEVADLVVVTKCDGNLIPAANHAATELSRALRTYQRMKHPLSGWRPRVLRCSALTGEGVPEVWQTVMEFLERVTDSGELVQHRVAQLEKWMWLHVREHLMDLFRESPAVAATLPALLDELRQGLKSPGNAADLLLRCFLENRAR
ncbi:hypothetical protein BOX15_Mlig002291g2, partial [Macrostomum lignano]